MSRGEGRASIQGSALERTVARLRRYRRSIYPVQRSDVEALVLLGPRSTHSDGLPVITQSQAVIMASINTIKRSNVFKNGRKLSASRSTQKQWILILKNIGARE